MSKLSYWVGNLPSEGAKKAKKREMANKIKYGTGKNSPKGTYHTKPHEIKGWQEVEKD